MSKTDTKQRVGFFKKQAPWVILAIIMFLLGYEFAYFNQKERAQNLSMLSRSSDNIAMENQQLIERLNQQKIELDLQTLSLQNTKRILAETLAREKELKEQISFYQRVVAPETSTDGFLIEHAELTSSLGQNAFTLNLVLLQQQNIKDTIQGSLDIRLYGTEKGEFTSYALKSLAEESQSFDYAFRYFQLKEIPFKVPENFLPQRFEIQTDVYRYKKKRGTYNRSLLWSDLVVDTGNT